MQPKTDEQQYADLCAVAGDLQYKVYCFKQDLAKANKQIYELNMKAHAKREVLAEAKAAEAEVVKE